MSRESMQLISRVRYTFRSNFAQELDDLLHGILRKLNQFNLQFLYLAAPINRHSVYKRQWKTYKLSIHLSEVPVAEQPKTLCLH